MLTTIFLLFIFGGLAVIAYLFWQKLPQVMTVDPKSSRVVREMGMKKQIIEARFKRKILAGSNSLSQKLKPYWQIVWPRLKKLAVKAIEIEEKYRAKLLRENFQKKVNQQQYIYQLLATAQGLFDQEKFGEAEKKYIDILALDERNAGAYQGLAKLYYVQNQLEQAQETLQFLVKLKPQDYTVYKQLAEVAKARGDLATAISAYNQVLELKKDDLETYLAVAQISLLQENFHQAHNYVQRAYTIEANNPRVLDFLIETSILVRDKDAAYQAYLQLKNVNPENNKLADFRERINKL